MSSNSPAGDKSPATNSIDARTKRALTECATVLDNVDVVRRAADMYLVVSESGREYIVDAREGRCTCPDHTRRQAVCKHIRRVEVLRGERPIPAGIDPEAIECKPDISSPTVPKG